MKVSDSKNERGEHDVNSKSEHIITEQQKEEEQNENMNITSGK